MNKPWHWPAALRVLFAFLALATESALAAEAGLGSIRGRVSNAKTNEYLGDAAVSLDGAPATVFSERDGSFLIASVAPGAHSLRVSYTGLDRFETKVNVTAGQSVVVEAELTTGVYKMDPFTITAEREGNALAITRQRAADNVKNVVSADAFGSAAEGNVADLLQRLPGITVSYTSADPDQVSIRGVSPELSTVTVDGMPVSNAVAGTARTFRFTLTSNISMLESVEVTKALTPEMDAASVGGAINMRSKTPFQSKVTQSFDYQLGGNIETRSDSAHRMNPTMSASYTRVFGDKRRVGLTLAANYTPYYQIQDQVGYTFLATLAVPAYVTRFFYVDGPKITYRRSGSTRLDFELAKNWTTYASVSANYYHAELANKVRDWTTVAAAVAPGYTELVTEALVNPSTATSFSLNNAIVQATSLLYLAGGRNKWENLDLDYDFSFSPGHQVVDTSGNRGAVTGNLTGVGWRLDRGKSTQYPEMRYTGGPDPQDLNNYGTLRYNTGLSFTDDDVWSSKANLRKTFATRWPSELKVGGVFKEQRREFENNAANFIYVGADGVAGRNPATGVNDDQFARFAETQYVRNPTTGGYPSAVWPSAAKLADRRLSAPNEFQADTYNNRRTYYQSLRNAREQIAAGYLQGKIAFGRLSFLGGVRLESTDVRGVGPVQGPILNTVVVNGQTRKETVAEALQRIRAETTAQRTARTAAEAARRTADPAGAAFEEFGSVIRTNNSNYKKYFPSLHARYAFTPNLLARASWATGIGRPNFTNIMPNETANYTNSTVSASNPELKPQYVKNSDVTLEYYFEPVGMLSVAVFRKDISDFIYTDGAGLIPSGADNGFNGLYDGFTLSTSKNGGAARIQGAEFAYQQQFTFLPGYFKGLGMFANYTKLNTSGDYGSNVPRNTSSVPGFVPRSANLGVSYSHGRVLVRAKWLYKSLALFSFSTNPASLRYNPGIGRWDLSARYRMTSHLDLYADAINITAVPMVFQGPMPGRRDSISDYGCKVSFGVSGRY
ncbi:MAG: TonB-dependent receptor [Verrucomicrobia bacterium]|nr:TonB-dependent receptor [Verrucomicrobiota bacterium]